MKKYITICLAAVLFGCAPQQEPVVSNAESYLATLQTLELNPKRYKSYQRYCVVIDGQMCDWLKQISHPEELRTLFWKCKSVWRAKPEVSQDKLQWIDPHYASLNLILYRLAEIQTSDAAKVLVDLRCDPKGEWDGHYSEAAGDAVVKCGKVALPFLREKKDSGVDTTRLIQLIESGATTGF